MNQFIIQLTKKLSVTTDPNLREPLVSEIAGTLARMGNFDQARRLVAEVRTSPNAKSGSISTIWVMIAEGLILLYEGRTKEALDKIARAEMLGKSINDPQIISRASAWKAHIEFELSNFGAMISSLQQSRATVADTDYSTHARVATVMMNSLLYIGDFEGAGKWFKRSHAAAVSAGDQASIEAVVYNKAAFSIARYRTQNCISDVAPDDINKLRTAIDSARNLGILVHISALKNHLDLIDARLSILEGQFETATEQICAIENDRSFEPFHYDASVSALELCYCRHKLGAESVIEEYAIDHRADTYCNMDLDEQVVANWMRLVLATSNPTLESPELARQKLYDVANKYNELQNDLRSKLTSLSSMVL